MRNLFSKLWKDDAGIVTLEYLVLGTILALGLIVGVTAVTAQLNSELSEFGNAIGGLNQNYSSSGFSNCVATHDGSGANGDRPNNINTHTTDPGPNNINDLPCQ